MKPRLEVIFITSRRCTCCSAYHFAGHCGAVGQDDGLDGRPHGWQQVLDEPVQQPLLSLGRADLLGALRAARHVCRQQHGRHHWWHQQLSGLVPHSGGCGVSLQRRPRLLPPWQSAAPGLGSEPALQRGGEEGDKGFTTRAFMTEITRRALLSLYKSEPNLFIIISLFFFFPINISLNFFNRSRLRSFLSGLCSSIQADLRL